MICRDGSAVKRMVCFHRVILFGGSIFWNNRILSNHIKRNHKEYKFTKIINNWVTLKNEISKFFLHLLPVLIVNSQTHTWLSNPEVLLFLLLILACVTTKLKTGVRFPVQEKLKILRRFSCRIKCCASWGNC